MLKPIVKEGVETHLAKLSNILFGPTKVVVYCRQV